MINAAKSSRPEARITSSRKWFMIAKVDHVYDYELGSGLTTKPGRMAHIDLYDPSNSKVETIA